MMLNPAKCALIVGSGKFLSLIVSKCGIETILEKIQAIFDMKSPFSIKYFQKLIGRVAALGWFISKSVDKCYTS